MVRTRFAPSPTGYLHIGGVRTALFCWLFARKHKGQFILRIDDTDVKRNVEEALQPILDGLRWLGIDWDEGPGVGGPFAPYYQSQRSEKYQQAVTQLLDSGQAYYDYATTEELQAEREAALAEKRPFRYSRRWMAQTPDDRRQFEAEGRRQPVVRLRIPQEGKLVLDDLVRGRVEFDWAQEQDHVIQRADGTCLYHLANVVDDHELQITHVIRAEEHLSNTPRQIFILESLGYPRPQYAHLPFVAEPGSKTKLSKRKLEKYLKNREFKERVDHGRRIAQRLGLNTDLDTFNPVIVDFYRQVGYLPEAVINYLALLGWSAGDDREQYTLEELIEAFSLDGVNKAPASFDPQKLWAFQDRHMRNLTHDRETELVLPFFIRGNLKELASPQSVAGDAAAIDSDPGLGGIRAARERASRLVKAEGGRLKVLGDIIEFADPFLFLFSDTFEYDLNLLEKRIKTPPLAVKLLERLMADLEHCESFEPVSLERLFHEFVVREGIKESDINHPVRVAITGRAVGPGLFDCLAVLDQEESLRRIRTALAFVRAELPEQRLTNTYRHGSANEQISLYQGPISIQSGISQSLAEGSVQLSWQPAPAITFTAKPMRGNVLHPGPAKVELKGSAPCETAFITSVSYGSEKTEFLGRVQPVVRDEGRDLYSLEFSLPNYHDYLGSAIGRLTANRLESWAGRTSFKNQDWRVTLDSAEGISSIVKGLSQTGGFRITHAGRLERPDKRAFLPSDISGLPQLLQQFFSFTRGFCVAPLLLIGKDRQGEKAWERWDAGLPLDSWRFVHSWFPYSHSECLDRLFPHFTDLCQASPEFLRHFIHWYVSANDPRRIELAVIAGEIALEQVARYIWQRSHEVAPTLRVGADVPEVSKVVHSALERANVPAAIPGSMVDLRKFGRIANITTGPDCIRALRDSILHGALQRLAKDGLSDRAQVLYDAWLLLLWYVELLMLYVLEYDGHYHNRIRMDQLTTTSEAVPWVAS